MNFVATLQYRIIFFFRELVIQIFFLSKGLFDLILFQDMNNDLMPKENTPCLQSYAIPSRDVNRNAVTTRNRDI